MFVVGLVLLTFLGWRFGFRNLAGLIQGAAPVPLLLMAALIVAGFWIRAWKWHYALGRGQQGVLLFFLAKTAGNWTPGRAGELAPLLLQRHRNARVAAWIGLDRVVEIAWTLGLGVLGVAALGMLPLPLAVGLVAIAALLSGLAWWWCARAGESQAPANATGTWRERLGRLVARLREELALFGRKMPLIMLLTATAKLTDVYAVILLCDAFGYGVSFLLVCAARCAHGLVSAIPLTPDATGVPFVAAAWLLHEQAGVPYDTLTAALGLEVLAINAILWACFCLVSGLRMTTTPNGPRTP